MEGDEILAINGRRVLLTGDISTILALENSETVDVTVRRNGETRVIEDLPLVPREYQVDGQTVTRYGLLFTAKEATVFDRIKVGCYTSVNFVRNVFWSFEMLFDGRAGFQDLSGPVGIVQTMSQVGEASPNALAALENILYLSAFIAVNLAVMNLLPLPALDGGRIFFLLLNGVLYGLFRRKIPPKYEGYVHMAGMAALLSLMLMVTLSDVGKLFGR